MAGLKTKPPQLTVAVMTYNESSLEEVCLELHQELKQLGLTFELLIIDDGSTDATPTLVKALQDKYQEIRSVTHPTNLGLSHVYRTGFAEAKGDWVTFFPGDGQFAAHLIGAFLEKMPSHDMVLGYFETKRPSAVGRCLSLAEKLTFRMLVGPFPKFQGILMFRRELLDTVSLSVQGRGHAVILEFVWTVSRNGYRVTSIPTTIRPRENGQSKVANLRTVASNVLQLAGLGLRRRLGRLDCFRAHSSDIV